MESCRSLAVADTPLEKAAVVGSGCALGAQETSAVEKTGPPLDAIYDALLYDLASGLGG